MCCISFMSTACHVGCDRLGSVLGTLSAERGLCLSSPMAELLWAQFGGRDMSALSHQRDKLGCATSLAEVLLALQAALCPGLLGTLLLSEQFSAHHTPAAGLGGKGWG